MKWYRVGGDRDDGREGPAGHAAQRWLARLAVLFAAAAVVIVPVFAELRSLAMLAVGLAAVAVSIASAYLFLARRGLLRWVSLAVFVARPDRGDRRVRVLLPAVGSGRVGGRDGCSPGPPRGWPWPATGTTGGCRSIRCEQPAAHPFLIMNPKSGGGKVTRFDLQRKASDLGAEVFLMSGPEAVDVAAVAREAVAGRGRSARRSGRRRHAGAGGRGRGPARPAVRGDHRRHPQSLRARSRAGPGRPVGLPRGPVRRG